MYGYIYKVTNTMDGKIYVGQHKSSSTDDNYLGSGKLIKRAVRKYGKNHFTKEILMVCDSKEELDYWEVELIEQLKTQDHTIGYNIAQGGHERFFTGCKHSEESRSKMSERAKNRPHPPTTDQTIWMHRDGQEKMIKPNLINQYLQDGWEVGRTTQVGGNLKGLTKDTSDTLKRVSKERLSLLKEHPIGCCGYGLNNLNHKKFVDKIMSIDRDEFVKDLQALGKCKTIEKYHIGWKNWNEVLKLLSI